MEEMAQRREDEGIGSYQFNKKFLMKVTVMGNAQLAYIINAKGPNTMLNAACSSTTQAVGIAEDWIRTGRSKNPYFELFLSQ